MCYTYRFYNYRNRFDNSVFFSISFTDFFLYILQTFRLLDCSETLVLPINIQFRILCSTDDVIHSFTICSLGMKIVTQKSVSTEKICYY